MPRTGEGLAGLRVHGRTKAGTEDVMNEKLAGLLRTYSYNKIDPVIPFGIAQEYLNDGNHEDSHHFFGVVYRDYRPYLPNYPLYVESLLRHGKGLEAETVAREGIEYAQQVGDRVHEDRLSELLQEALRIK